MKGLILAAGRGERLGAHTADKPKSLLKVGGKSLIERSLDNLKQVGFTQVIIVVGYQHHMLEEVIQKNYSDDFCKIIKNEDYTRGSGSSLMCATEDLSGDLLIVESDLLYDASIAKRMADAQKNAFALGDFGHDRKEIKIRLENGYVKSAAWGEPDEQADGDWVGFTRLTPQGAKALATLLKETDPEQGKEINYEDFLIDISKQMPFSTVNILDLPWIEIDNEEDLHKAEKEVCPKIDSNKNF